MPVTKRLFLMLLLSCSMTMPLQAEVYKWTDADGVVRYGQLPPPGVEARPLGRAASSAADNSPASADSPGPAGKGVDPAVDEAELEQIRNEQAERVAKREAELAEYCANARAEMKKLEERPASRFLREGENGEPVRLSQAEYDAHRNKIQAGIDEYCN